MKMFSKEHIFPKMVFSRKPLFVSVLFSLWPPYVFFGLVLERQEDIRYHESLFEITGTLDLKGLLSEGLPTILVLGGEGCSSCEKMKSMLQEPHTLLRGKANIRYLDIWKYPHLERVFPPVGCVPSEFFFDRMGDPFLPVNPEEWGFLKYVSPRTGKHTFTGHEGRMEKKEILEVLEEMEAERI